MTATMTNALPAFRLIFTFSSKKRTRGLAINAMIQPATNGAKNTNSFGTRKTIISNIINAIPRFTKALQYFFIYSHSLTYYVSTLIHHSYGLFLRSIPVQDPLQPRHRPGSRRFLPFPVSSVRNKVRSVYPLRPAGWCGSASPASVSDCG